MVYIETDDYDFNQLNIKPKPIDLDIDNYKEHNAFFQRLKTPLYKESAMQNICLVCSCLVTTMIFTMNYSKKEQWYSNTNSYFR